MQIGDRLYPCLPLFGVPELYVMASHNQ